MVYATDTAPFTDILLENEFIKTPPRLGGQINPEHAAKLRAMRDGLVELCRGADLVIYDTQFTPEEYRQRPHWGHSTPDDAIEIALAAKAKALALFHHSPERSDDAQDVIVRQVREQVGRVGVAVDVEAVARHEDRREEREALDVVPVGVRQQHRGDALAAPHVAGHELVPEAHDAGPHVEDDQLAARAVHRDARGVAAVAVGLGPRRRDRPAHAPEADPHAPRSPTSIVMPSWAATSVSPLPATAGTGLDVVAAMEGQEIVLGEED